MITKLLNEVNENIKTLNNLVQDKEYFEKLDERIEKVNNYVQEQKQEIERLNNIIKRLEEFIEKEIELYTLELTEKNTNALSYSLPIRGVYKEIYNVLQELKGSDKE